MVRSTELDIGTKVVLKDDLRNGMYGIMDCENFRGKTVTVRRVDYSANHVYFEETHGYWYKPDMFDHIIPEPFEAESASIIHGFCAPFMGE